MRLKTSLFNKEIFKQDFRAVGWISIVYFLGLFFLVPLPLFMDLNTATPTTLPVENDGGLLGSMFAFELQAVFLLILPVLMAVFLFRYLQTRDASDFAHSLPISRGRLLNHHLVSGIVLLLVPVLLNFIILVVTSWIADVSGYFTMGNAAYWLVLFCVMSILLFMTGVFVGTLTGLSAVHAVITYIFLLFPAGMYLLISYYLDMTINGFSGVIVQEETIQHLSPITDVLTAPPSSGEASDLPLSQVSLWTYGLASVVIYGLSYVIYQRRALETATKAVTVPALRPVFKFGVTFCTALLGGMYFGLSLSSYGWMVFGWGLGGTFGYMVSVMLLEKTWRVFHIRLIKNWLVYTGSAGAVLALLPLGWQSYEAYIPEQETVVKAYISEGYGEYEQHQIDGTPISYITSGEGIESVLNLHEALVEYSEPMVIGEDYFFIHYELENGREVQRQYQTADPRIEAARQAVYETEEGRNIRYPALTLESGQVDRIHLDPNGKGRPQTIMDDEKVTGLLKALQEDLRSQSYEEMAHPSGMYSWISFRVRDESNEIITNPYQTTVYEAYERTTAWLKKEGLYEEFMVGPGDIAEAVVFEWPEEQLADDYPRFIYDRLMEQGVEPLAVEGDEKIEPLLQGEHNQDSGAYIVALYYDDTNKDHNEIVTFTKENAPDFVRQYFE
ncbi:DUF6449 domain-containing protein [Halobacillus sp. Cin3]|uniref:DUF6449 domain-containing protein n=1 Tax=Halobacillus sp. Cin3 TaxID=2928441 RepID=UPI00248E9E90|nr:DUF6449 domain-containing protein [Halobacillus sp. Cin3]